MLLLLNEVGVEDQDKDCHSNFFANLVTRMFPLWAKSRDFIPKTAKKDWARCFFVTSATKMGRLGRQKRQFFYGLFIRYFFTSSDNFKEREKKRPISSVF